MNLTPITCWVKALDEARKALKVKTGLTKLNNMPEPERLLLYGETEYQTKSWKGLDTQIIYKAEVNQKSDTFCCDLD